MEVATSESEDDEDSDAEDSVVIHKARKKDRTFSRARTEGDVESSDKYIRLRHALAETKQKLDASRKREKKILEELARINAEKEEATRERKRTADSQIKKIVRKHGGGKHMQGTPLKPNTTKTVTTPRATTTSRRTTPTRAAARTTPTRAAARKKRVPEPESDDDEDSYSVQRDSDGPSLDDGNSVPLRQPTSDGEDNEEITVPGSPEAQQIVVEMDTVLESPEKESAAKKKIPEKATQQKTQEAEQKTPEGIKKDPKTTQQKMPETEQSTPKGKKKDPCNGHKTYHDFKQEDNPSFMNPGQKFADAICMKCGQQAKIAANKPILFCPNFEDVCDACLCNECYRHHLSNAAVDRCSTRRTRQR